MKEKKSPPDLHLNLLLSKDVFIYIKKLNTPSGLQAGESEKGMATSHQEKAINHYTLHFY